MASFPQVLAGFVNALLLLIVSTSIILEAIERLMQPQLLSHEHDLLAVSIIGLVVNVVRQNCFLIDKVVEESDHKIIVKHLCLLSYGVACSIDRLTVLP